MNLALYCTDKVLYTKKVNFQLRTIVQGYYCSRYMGTVCDTTYGLHVEQNMLKILQSIVGRSTRKLNAVKLTGKVRMACKT